MKLSYLIAIALSLTLTACGVYGPTSHDSGGIIPWSPEAEANADDFAQNACARYGNYAVITSVHRVYGDYIVYRCQWKPPARQRPIQSIR